jgi:hypothetical protein
VAFFSDDELADMRAEQESSFDQTCTVRTFGAIVVDVEGGGDPTSTETSVPCRVGNPTAQERVIAARLGQEMDNVVTLPYGTVVASTTKIVVDSSTYEVVTTNDGQSNQAAVRVMVKRVT